MDYLRTLGSAAVSTLVAKSGLNLPFSLGNKVSASNTIYSLYEGTKRVSPSSCSSNELTPIFRAGRWIARFYLRIRLYRCFETDYKTARVECSEKASDNQASRRPEVHGCCRVGLKSVYHDRAGSALVISTSFMVIQDRTGARGLASLGIT